MRWQLHTHVCSFAGIILAILVTAIVVVAVITAVGVDSWLDWNRFLLFVSYVKLAISIMKYLPQVYLNWKRKSTVGWKYVHDSHYCWRF